MISNDNLRQYHIISDKNIRLYQTMIAFWSDDDLVIRVMTLMVIMMMMEFIPLSWWWNYDYDDNRYLFLSAVLYVGEKSGKELGGWGLQLFHKLLQHFNDHHKSFLMLFGMMTMMMMMMIIGSVELMIAKIFWKFLPSTLSCFISCWFWWQQKYVSPAEKQLIMQWGKC